MTAAHRMLKNDVVSTTGWQAYALLSAAAAGHLEVSVDGWTELDLDYEHVDRMSAFVTPLVAAD